MATAEGRWVAAAHTLHSPPVTQLEVLAAIASARHLLTAEGGCQVLATTVRDVAVALAVDVQLQPGVPALQSASLSFAAPLLAGHRVVAAVGLDSRSLWPVGTPPRTIQCVIAAASPTAARGSAGDVAASFAPHGVGPATGAGRTPGTPPLPVAPPAGGGGEGRGEGAERDGPTDWLLAMCYVVGEVAAGGQACTSILVHADEPTTALLRRIAAVVPAAVGGCPGMLVWSPAAHALVPADGDGAMAAGKSLHVVPGAREAWVAVMGGAPALRHFDSGYPPVAHAPWVPGPPVRSGLDAGAPPWRPGTPPRQGHMEWAATAGVPTSSPLHAVHGGLGGGGRHGGWQGGLPPGFAQRSDESATLHPRAAAALAHLRACASAMVSNPDADDGGGWAAVVDLAQLREALQALRDVTFGDKGMSMRMGSRTAATSHTDGVREALYDAGGVAEATTVLAHVPHASTVHRQVLEQAIQLCTNIAFNSRAQLAMAAPDQQVVSVLCRRMVADGDCPEIQIKVARCLSTLAFENPPGVDHIIGCGGVAAACTALRRHAHHSFAVEKVAALLCAIAPSPAFAPAAAECDLRNALVAVAAVEWVTRSARGGSVRGTLLHLASGLDGDHDGGEAAHAPGAAAAAPAHDPFRARFSSRASAPSDRVSPLGDFSRRSSAAERSGISAATTLHAPAAHHLPGMPYTAHGATSGGTGGGGAGGGGGGSSGGYASPTWPGSPPAYHVAPSHAPTGAPSRMSWASAPMPAVYMSPTAGPSSGSHTTPGSGAATPYMPPWGGLPGSHQ